MSSEQNTQSQHKPPLIITSMMLHLVHYTPVLLVLFLIGGQHLFQDEIETVDEVESWTVASWEYCFPRCPLFVNSTPKLPQFVNS